MRRALSAVAVLSSLALPLAGCGAPPSADQVTMEIKRWLPGARFEREEHVRLGRIKMGLVKGIVRMVDDEDAEDRAILREVDRVEVATYRVLHLPDTTGLREKAPSFERQLARSGWNLTIKAQEGNEPTWLFTRGDGEGGLRNLLVVELDDEELTIVRMDGRLDRALAEAVAERPREAMRGAE